MNMIHLFLEDDEYEKLPIDHVREVARAVILDEKGKVAILHLKRDDIFGNYEYYELPGGGKNKDESEEEAVLREVEEETGVEGKILAPLGIVEDYYNLIHRKNINRYYLIKEVGKERQHLEEYEKQMIQEVLWVEIDEAIHRFENMPSTGVSQLVRRREIPILLEAKKEIEKRKNLSF